MTFEELKALRQKIKEQASRLYREEDRAECQYIEERLPFPLKMYQRITVDLEVTEKTRSTLLDEYKVKPRYQAGRRYSVTGMIIGWHIAEDGEIRPCFWGGKPYYHRYDKILNIRIAEKQNPEKCTSCWHYRDGGCWITGNSNPDKQVDENSFVCGYYHERRKQ